MSGRMKVQHPGVSELMLLDVVQRVICRTMVDNRIVFVGPWIHAYIVRRFRN